MTERGLRIRKKRLLRDAFRYYFFLFLFILVIIVTTIHAARKTPAIIKSGIGSSVPVIGFAAIIENMLIILSLLLLC